MQTVQGAAAGIAMTEPTVFSRSVAGRKGYSLPAGSGEVEACAIPSEYLREQLPLLPELSEPDMVRHFTRLSQWNYGVDTGFYPLGSCTMKYNPKVNEFVCRLPGLAHLHPYMPTRCLQGALRLMFELESFLAELGGFAAVTLQPAAGAHGELTGMSMVRAYHQQQGQMRSKVLIPDTAHGTNPASCAINSYEVVQVPTGPEGVLLPNLVARAADSQTAAIMLTNPNTLGLFERNIAEIAEIIHSVGGLVYCDGANMNSLMGRARPGDMGVDVLQFNLHKTFSTPHGGGGPGSGPVGVSPTLVPYLPVPRIVRSACGYDFDLNYPLSIGRMKAFYGQFGVMVRAFAYILEMGTDGLRHATDMAVLNANYLQARLSKRFHVAFDGPCMHECVLSDKGLSRLGCKTIDLAKGLIDLGFHPPTVYFPLCVSGALMIEPTETESLETLDAFADALLSVLDQAEQDPQSLQTAPNKTKVSRLDEVAAVRRPILTWSPIHEQDQTT